MPRLKMYDKSSTEAWECSRTAIDEFLNDPHTFVMRRKLGLMSVPSFPLNLNTATDEILKEDFDALRDVQESNYWLFAKYNLNVVPFQHEDFKRWRDGHGVRAIHEPTNFDVYGKIDDIWQDRVTGELIVVDYKSTARAEPEYLKPDYYRYGLGSKYKKQQEVYQWLLRRNGFEVSTKFILLYVDGDRRAKSFFPEPSTELGRLDFRTSIMIIDGDDSWIEQTLHDMKAVLDQDDIPEPNMNEPINKYFYQRMQILEGKS